MPRSQCSRHRVQCTADRSGRQIAMARSSHMLPCMTNTETTVTMLRYARVYSDDQGRETNRVHAYAFDNDEAIAHADALHLESPTLEQGERCTVRDAFGLSIAEYRGNGFGLPATRLFVGGAR